MSWKKHQMHGRDHLPTGADPVAFTASVTMQEGGALVGSTTVTTPWTTKRVVTLSSFYGDATYFAMDSSNQGIAILVTGVYGIFGELAITDPGAGHAIPPTLRIYLTEFGTDAGAPSGNAYIGGSIQEYPSTGSIDNAFSGVGGLESFYLETGVTEGRISGVSVGIGLQATGAAANWAYEGQIYCVHLGEL